MAKDIAQSLNETRHIEWWHVWCSLPCNCFKIKHITTSL